MSVARFRVALCGALLLAAVAAPSAAAAQQPLTFGSWQMFTWVIQNGDGADPVDGEGFTFQSLFQTRIRITDAGDAGDAFSIFVNGSPYGISPSVVYAPIGAYDGDEAWATPQFSHFEFLLDPGHYTITMNVREDAGYGYGEGFIRADQITGQSVTPEPATLLLTGSGLAGLLAVAHRRRRAAAAHAHAG